MALHQQSLHNSTRAQLAETIKLAEQGDARAFESLEAAISAPPRANDPDRDWFDSLLQAFAQLLETVKAELPTETLRRLASLNDIGRDVIYYLEDDARYDVGHDFLYADYARVHEIAQAELERRE
ncbi:MAG: hypothetical protein ACK2US_15750 [Anaerolineae bacterium]|jgi:hypothetical protein